MTAPVVGFSAEVPNGLHGESLVLVEPDWPVIAIVLQVGDDERTLVVTHDEARQIIAGLASVIT